MIILVLTGEGFAESRITDLHAPFPVTRPTHIDLYEYGYASDSDLEDEEPLDDELLTTPPPSRWEGVDVGDGSVLDPPKASTTRAYMLHSRKKFMPPFRPATIIQPTLMHQLQAGLGLR